MSQEKWTAADVRAALREKYPSSRYALFFEVADATGARQSRWADAVAMDTWPSGGLSVHGFEIKVSRQDWLKELEQAGKSQAISRYCDRWWLVAGNEGIVKPGELPASWGMIARSGNGLKVECKAPKLEPIPMSREFMAAMLRRGSQTEEANANAIAERRLLALKEQHERHIKSATERSDRLYAELLAKVSEFEQASGISINRSWHGAREIGEAVKFVLDGGLRSQIDRMRGIRSVAQNLMESIDKIDLLMQEEAKQTEEVA